MKALILAGGKGTRLSEETLIKPKPMIEIGGKPILWHIMKIYSFYGVNEFIICCGYKGFQIKQYFANYWINENDITCHIDQKKIEVHTTNTESWKVTLIDTGESTETGGRLKRISKYLNNEDVCMTYGDGLSDINISELIKFHCAHNSPATITSVRPQARFGALKICEDGITVENFNEKPISEGGRINGGFFILNSKIFEEIESDETKWEQEPLVKLSQQKKLKAFTHNGFWHPMDTLRDKNYLNKLWNENKAPWKIW